MPAFEDRLSTWITPVILEMHLNDCLIFPTFVHLEYYMNEECDVDFCKDEVMRKGYYDGFFIQNPPANGAAPSPAMLDIAKRTEWFFNHCDRRGFDGTRYFAELNNTLIEKSFTLMNDAYEEYKAKPDYDNLRTISDDVVHFIEVGRKFYGAYAAGYAMGRSDREKIS